MQTFRFACRSLARAPGFTAAAILTLGLGIGFSVSSFSLTNALLLRDLPYPEAHRLVRIFRASPQSSTLPHAPANVVDVCAEVTSFSGTALFNPDNYAYGEPGQPAERVTGLGATATLFDVLRVQPLLGRGFAAGDDQPGQPPVTVISHRAWTQRFGADPGVLGRTVRLNARTFTIVGVLPPSFDAPLVWGRTEFITPITLSPGFRANRTSRWVQCVARLRPGVGLEEAQSELTAIAARLVDAYPKENADMRLRVTGLHDSNFGNTTRTIVWFMTGISLSMLLIACANLAGLQLARAFARTRDFAVRAALGASRRQLMLPLLAESLVLGAAGGAAGLVVAVWANDLTGSAVFVDPEVRGFNIPIDPRVLVFAAVVSLLSSVAFGLTPAWMLARASTQEALKDTARAATPGQVQQRLKRALVAGTLALALALVGVTASFAIGFWSFMHRPLHWEPDGLFAGNIVLPEARFADKERQRTFQRELLARLAAVPAVRQVSLSGSVPLYSLDAMARTTAILAEGQPPPLPGQEVAVEANAVTADYFAALRIRLLQGRVFSPDLKADDPPVGIINRSLAERFWPGQDPIGRRLRFTAANTLAAGEEWFEVTGVVDDVAMLIRLDVPPTRLQVYRPQVQVPGRYLTIVVRGDQPPETLVAPVRKTVAGLDPDIAVAFAGPLRARADLFQANLSLVIANFAISAGLGLLIAAVGLFGVISQLTVQRTREIGVRIALGARSADILGMIFAEGGRLLAIGLAAGIPSFLALNLVLRRGVPEVGLPGAWLLLTNLAVLAAVTFLACWLPARRATRINPVDALRAE